MSQFYKPVIRPVLSRQNAKVHNEPVQPLYDEKYNTEVTTLPGNEVEPMKFDTEENESPEPSVPDNPLVPNNRSIQANISALNTVPNLDLRGKKEILLYNPPSYITDELPGHPITAHGFRLSTYRFSEPVPKLK